MFPLALSLFDTGLLITVVIFMILYLIVLIKLKSPTVEEETVETKSVQQENRKPFSTERRNNPIIYPNNRGEHAGSVKAFEKPKFVATVPVETEKKAFEEPKFVATVPVETEKNEFSRGSEPSGCPRHFGYLKEHPKRSPIPNECLTCPKIMECL
jgi:hypothetical protein